MRTIQKSAMLAMVLTLPAMAASSAPPEPAKTREYQVEDLCSEDFGTRSAAFTALRDQQRQLIEDLTAMVGREKTAREQFLAPPTLAAQLLGNSGSMGDGVRTSIPTLIEHVEYRAPMLDDELVPLCNHPCAIALRGIGHTSVAYILTHLQTTAPEKVSDNAMELYAHIMIQIYGPSTLDECIAWVEVRAGRSIHSPGTPNFERLLGHLNEYRNKLTPKP